MCPRAGLDNKKKKKSLTLPGLELRHLCRPDPSHSLYRLRYPDSLLYSVEYTTLNNELEWMWVKTVAV
jgi:hypothetical protein